MDTSHADAAPRARRAGAGLSSPKFVVALMLLVVAVPLHAGTIHVPADHPTVQAAIAAAADGDTILVAPGTYHEVIDFLGKDIAVIANGGAEVTILDGTGLGTSVVTIVSGEPATALLQGFTITGGSGHPFGEAWYGGGVYMASPATLRECVITGNHVPAIGASGAGYGGGVFASPGEFVACSIVGNSATSQGGGVYGGFFIDPPTLFDCTIAGNSAAVGGGVAYVNCEACTIADNTALDAGGGAYGGNGWLSGCTLRGNTARTGGGAAGVAVFDCLIENNSATDVGGGYYATAVFTAILSHCTVRGNAAGLLGGGAYLIALNDSLFATAGALDCVFVDNEAPQGDGLWASASSAVGGSGKVVLCTFSGDSVMSNTGLVIESSIFRDLPVPFGAGGIITVRFSDIEGGWPGDGNIDADPLFVDPSHGDFHLDPSSPCRNAGNPFLFVLGFPAPENDTDLDGDPRKLEGIVDMGADEFTPDCNGNGVFDYEDIAGGTSLDCDGNGTPDECDPFVDCNGNGLFDACDIAFGSSTDCDADGVPDECIPLVDCNGNGQFDTCDITAGVSTDCNGNGVPDECDVLLDCNGNGILDACDVASGFSDDCNANGVPDDCDLAAGTSADIDGNGVPDECTGFVFVPRDAPTIQAGLDRASPGSTVMVAPGTWSGPGNTNLSFGGKALLLTSQMGAESCVIDGGGTERLFDFAVADDSDAVLRGFTLQRALASLGGAIRCQSGSGPTILDCRFLDNVASTAGGAVSAQPGSAPTLVRCVLARNTAPNGGALRIGGAVVGVEHCTFVDNTTAGSGGSVRVQLGGELLLRDSILRGGSALAGAELAVEGAGSTASVSFSDVAGGQAGVFTAAGGALSWGAGNIDADPQFVNASADDFHLLPGSACINTGDPAGPLDLDLSPPDMGAFPYSPWTDLGGGVAGSDGLPALLGNGPLIGGQFVTLTLSQAAPRTSVTVVLGASALGAPFKGGVFWPAVNALLTGVPTDADGTLVLSGPWPAGLPSGFSFWTQIWFADGGAPFGFAGSNGVRGTAP